MLEPDANPWDDPTTVSYWEGAERRELLVQRCTACSAHQLYPRPYCLRCQGEIEWVRASGDGTVYSKITVHLQTLPELEPPYDVILVELDEGPRMLATPELGTCEIGDRVELVWQQRETLPPLPQFRKLGGHGPA
jgi:uncharacterized protein